MFVTFIAGSVARENYASEVNCIVRNLDEGRAFPGLRNPAQVEKGKDYEDRQQGQ